MGEAFPFVWGVPVYLRDLPRFDMLSFCSEEGFLFLWDLCDGGRVNIGKQICNIVNLKTEKFVTCGRVDTKDIRMVAKTYHQHFTICC